MLQPTNNLLTALITHKYLYTSTWLSHKYSACVQVYRIWYAYCDNKHAHTHKSYLHTYFTRMYLIINNSDNRRNALKQSLLC